jgi:hypothetical protein
MAEDQTPAASEWLEMTDAQFDEIRAKTDVILHSLPSLLERTEATARATLGQRDNREIETLSRKRLIEQLLAYADGSLQQAEYMRGLLGMLDSTWRCLAEIRHAYRAEVAQRTSTEAADVRGKGSES